MKKRYQNIRKKHKYITLEQHKYMHPHIKEYLQSISALYAQGITTEHSFRGALETLLKNMTGFTVVNEA
ncbi:MAG: hypothetical protein LBJ17_07985, partial [Dysgonamonadaceae bacterium]|nr:hypothetical protein [Dysgonamonadaceae bacterium]